MFYLKERIPNWIGAARRIDSYSNQVINPLSSTGMIRLSLSCHHFQRQQNLLHFMANKKISKELLDIPFAGQVWDQALKNPEQKIIFFLIQ